MIGGSLLTSRVVLSPEQYATLVSFTAEERSGLVSLEVERKWRVNDRDIQEFLEALVSEGISSTATFIEQGYLVLGGSEVRLRRRGADLFLTLKSSGGLIRREVEVALSPEQFEVLWVATEGRRLEKTRTSFALPQSPGAPLAVEFDQFHGALSLLQILECEFPSAAIAESFEAPSWFGVEVTEDAAYKNRALVEDGAPHLQDDLSLKEPHKHQDE
jgi:CYTH domain-containing protein